MTTMPLARMAATLVVNSRSAARDWRGGSGFEGEADYG
jgi:hypothetical protein